MLSPDNATIAQYALLNNPCSSAFFMERSTWIIVLVIAIVVILGAGLLMWMRPFSDDALTQGSSGVPGSSGAQREGTTTSGGSSSGASGAGSGTTSTGGTGTGQGSSDGTPSSSPSAPSFVEVLMTGSSFEPNEAHVAQGGTVMFRNGNPEGFVHPASNPHPSHTGYPGSNANWCGTSEQSKAFDSCEDVGFSDSWSFTFSEKGSWSYHDHLNPSISGVVIVE